MVQGIPALLATLAALAGTGLLIARAKSARLSYLVAWCVTLAGISIALGAMAAGFIAGFGSLLFRAMEAGGALIAPVWLALGMIVLISRPVQVRFAAWLLAISYSVVAVVILLLDPVKGSFGDALPDPRATYDALPLLLIDLAHMIAVVALAVCTAVTAVRAGKRDREAYALLMPVALVALAGVLAVAASRGFLPGLVAVLAFAGSAGLVWFGGMRTLPVGEARGVRGGRAAGDEEHAGEEYPGQEYAGQEYAGQGFEEYGQVERYGERPEHEERAEQVYPDQEYGQFHEQPPGRAAYDSRFDRRPPPPPRPQPGPPPEVPRGMDGRAAGRFPARDGAAGMPPAPAGQPMCGQITVYTLLEGREEAFDRVAAEAVRAARAAEPDTLIFACHQVTGAPTQRIVYQLFRDHAAFEEHQRQPHVQRFLADSRPYVLATNVIDLRLSSAKVMPLPSLAGQEYM